MSDAIGINPPNNVRLSGIPNYKINGYDIYLEDVNELILKLIDCSNITISNFINLRISKNEEKGNCLNV